MSFRVKKKTTLSIIGKNGSGKSTLLKLLASISFPSQGEIISYGKIAAILEIGTGFHPDLTGKENVYFYASMLGISKKSIDSLYSSIVEFSEIQEFIHQPIKNYSDGMYLRLAFSVAIHCDVDTIIFDEVLTVGDNAFNLKCIEKIRELKDSKNIILVSHSMSDVIRISDECIWIDEGEIKSIGNPYTVVAEYMESHWRTSRFVQHVTLNTQKFHYNIDSYNEDKSVYIQEGRVYGTSGNSELKGISYNEAINIEFSLILMKNFPLGLTPGIMLFDQTNISIMVSTSLFGGNITQKLFGTGQYSVQCKLPKQLLNAGLYKIHFHLFDTSDKAVISIYDTVIFKVIIEDDAHLEILKKSSLSLSSSLQWEVNHIGESNK